MVVMHYLASPDKGLDKLKHIELTDFSTKFDHTNLKPTSGKNDISRLCKEAVEYGFAAVCVAPRWVAYAAKRLSGKTANAVRICTVVGFPHGNTTTEDKKLEAVHAIENGASEIDMVISIGDLRDGNKKIVEYDIATVVEAVHDRSGIVKVILETAFLEDREITLGCKLSVQAGADYVKTSTGFGPKGADARIVRLMRQTVGDAVGVKAAGGIRTLADVRSMLDAGASRIGCSSSPEIVREFIETLPR